MQVALPELGTVLEIADADFVAARRATPAAPNLPNPAAAIRDALENPRNFPSLRRALTPDDRVAVVVDDRLPHLGPMVGALLAYLADAGIPPASVTLVSAPGAAQAWVVDLPDAFQEARTEIHDPANRKAVAYLATTRKGRRVYLNRSVVEAEQTIVLAGCRYDPMFGRYDGPCALFPVLSDGATLKDTNRHLSMAAPNGGNFPLHEEANEVAWLLGVPFMIHAVEGSGDGLAHLVGGTVETVSDCHGLLDARWKVRVDRPAQIVVASLGGDPARHDFEALARAALCASRVVEPNGRIVILSRGKPKLGEAAEILRETDNPAVASRRIQERQPADRVAVMQWLEAARDASIYLLSGLPDETVEEMFATPLQQARQVQRLLGAGGSCLFIEDAQQTLAVVET